MDVSCVFRIILISLVFLIAARSTFAAVSDEERLQKYLIENYGQAVRPVSNRSRPIVINATVYFIKLIGLREKEQEYEYAATLNLVWLDPKLKWNASEFGGYDDTVISTKALPMWLPDISLYNGVDIDDTYDLSKLRTFTTKVISSGYVVWLIGHSFRTVCHMNIKYFPFDTQTCTSTFLCPTMQRELLEFRVPTPYVMSDYPADNGEWIMVSNRTYSSVTYRRLFNGLTEEKNNFNAVMVLRRKPLYYIINIILPTTTVSVLILLVYCLPPDCGEKINLGVTVLLTFSVFQLMVADTLPSSSDEPSILGVYLLWQMVLSAISVAMSVIVLNITTKDKRIPAPMRSFLFTHVARAVGLTQAVWDYGVAKVTEQTTDQLQNQNSKTDHVNGIKLEGRSEEAFAIKTPDTATYKHVKRIASYLKVYAQTMDDRLTEADVQNEWKLAARIIDRLLLVTSCVVMFVSTTMFLSVLVHGDKTVV
ncbi:neuronal acetylcholine receptor subunit alpha-3-like isoform X2 [Lineus longissimus]|uniref:neuronal acetylcholine receptor subunit alpha-3-like isoform X2 n=1 Tax=Lineus longissimus TaxID=88925 RepID=UPI002B4F1593